MRDTIANRTEGHTDWSSINWREANRSVRNLRQRIFRATREGDWDKVQSLQRLINPRRQSRKQGQRRP